jgi:hypothetical protein
VNPRGDVALCGVRLVDVSGDPPGGSVLESGSVLGAGTVLGAGAPVGRSSSGSHAIAHSTSPAAMHPIVVNSARPMHLLLLV